MWLLLLLLLTLFIKCERNIDVYTIDPIANEGVEDVEVTLSYTSHFLFDQRRFFFNDPVTLTETTDSYGHAKFSGLPCSVFSYIFYALSKAEFTTSHDCYQQINTPDYCLFHYTKKKDILMEPKTTNLPILVIDRETLEPLAGATVVYGYDKSGQLRSDSVVTFANGQCTLENVPECGDVDIKLARCYGYADTTDVKINVAEGLAYPESAVVPLTPLKLKFNYFVKNKFTHQPIPGATVTVILTTHGGASIRGTSTTNVDGKGIGVYEDAFMLADLQLKASKKNYKDGQFEKKCTVEEFADLPDSLRVIYLEPEPYLEQFQDVDSITGEPLAGVTNSIQVNSITGKTENNVEISNSNGFFGVKAMEGDQILIHSEFLPYYEIKDTKIDSFSVGEKIRLNPKTTDLLFRTIDSETAQQLPHCDLAISSSKSGANSPTESGDGAFTVPNLLLSETISITASKDGYSTNSVTINGAKVMELMNAPQERRDIPLDPRKKFQADVVMCIDCTGSMGSIINTIKQNAFNFYSDIKDKCEAINHEITGMRIKVIGFRDLTDAKPFEISTFFDIPSQEHLYRGFVNTLAPVGGGDGPERGYDALYLAMKSDWNLSEDVHQVIILWTDAESHPLSGYTGTMANMKARWEADMDKYKKRMIIFAPNLPSWTLLERDWKNTIRHDVGIGKGLSDVDYDDIINAIAGSI